MKRKSLNLSKLAKLKNNVKSDLNLSYIDNDLLSHRLVVNMTIRASIKPLIPLLDNQ